MARVRIRFIVGASFGALLSAAASAQTPTKSEAPKANPDVAAYVGGEPITLQELDAKALADLKLAQSLYDARRAALDQILLDRLLGKEAAAKGSSVDKLTRERIAEKVKPVTDEDVDAYFNANKARMGGKTLEQVSGQIRAQLTTQRENDARKDLLKELKEKGNVRITLAVPRAGVVIAANEPAKGPVTAKVTIVEYSDFQ